MKISIQRLKDDAILSTVIMWLIFIWYCVWKVFDIVCSEGITLNAFIIAVVGFAIAWAITLFMLLICPLRELLRKMLIGE
ncbi:MAG: hypothetical protein DRJ62_07725 [Thermoprotei archaeon]|nr:MAG: hypothetical protein DRJ62_07725 [Thermoprotei archaeon]